MASRVGRAPGLQRSIRLDTVRGMNLEGGFGGSYTLLPLLFSVRYFILRIRT